MRAGSSPPKILGAIPLFLSRKATEADAKLTSLRREVEKLSGRVNVLVDASLVDFVRSCRDVLTGVFRGELR